MKKIFLAILFSFLVVNVSFADVIDDSINKELEKKSVENNFSMSDFEMKKYSSCENIDEVLNKYIKKIKIQKPAHDFRLKTFAEPLLDGVISSTESIASSDFSNTNTQVLGVDESEIVKTDGKNIYYFSEKDNEKFIYVLSLDKKKILKKIKIPAQFYSTEFYLKDNKLVILGSFYNENIFKKRSFYYINSQTYTIIYDISDLDNLKLEKFYSLDGNYRNSRLIGDKLYVISENNFDLYNSSEKFSFIDSIPQKLDIKLNSSDGKYSMKKNLSSDCKNVEFFLPPEKYFDENDFSLNYTILSTIDIKDSSKDIKTKILASSTSEIYMNEKNLYLTSNLNYNTPFFCIGCFFPSYNSKDTTLVNKFSIYDGDINYKKSVMIDGAPLTKYSMDEDKEGNFRILTQIHNWQDSEKNYTNLYILDKDLKLLSKLEKLGQKEDFKSSRYIGDKLFLVTFEKVDPLFVIDLKDSKNPKILGELKIPGYSTYLHPYDDNHLIGLGYDTKENKWGGVQNSGLKLDLYQINYDKKCGDSNLSAEEKQGCENGNYKGIIAKQIFTKTFGGSGTTSEAIYNPKMFIYNSIKNKLFLPLIIMDYDQKNDYFNGVLSISIDKNKGIKEDLRVTNLDISKIQSDRIEECKKYEIKPEKTCKKLLNGEEICGYTNINSIPNYCFEESNIGSYLSSNIWKYNDSLIKRALWVGENFFSISSDKIKANNIDSGKEVLNVDLK